MARVADQAERYEDMVEFLTEVIQLKEEDLTTEERNLLSVGFKNLISSSRAAWRTVGAIEQNGKYAEYSSDCAVYKTKVEAELADKCKKVINIVKDNSLLKAKSPESQTFYLKMIGDYYRYSSRHKIWAPRQKKWTPRQKNDPPTKKMTPLKFVG